MSHLPGSPFCLLLLHQTILTLAQCAVPGRASLSNASSGTRPDSARQQKNYFSAASAAQEGHFWKVHREIKPIVRFSICRLSAVDLPSICRFRGPICRPSAVYLPSNAGPLAIWRTRFSLVLKERFTQRCFSALEGLRRQWACEYGAQGIRVVTIKTGGVPESIGESSPEMDAFKASITEGTLLKRAATLADVGSVAAFLASDLARTIAPTEINISAGAIVD
jgi:hypothetical protein